MVGTAAPPAKRVVIVDDSQTMRLWLAHVLNQDPRLEVVGQAANAAEARRTIRDLRPDVITLDIEMPGMDGLTFLERLMVRDPLPVVMVAGQTRQGSATAIRALSLGAVDCVMKPGNALDLKAQRSLVRQVYAAACSQVRPLQGTHQTVTAQFPAAQVGPQPLVLIGASTGGVTALERILRDLHPAGPPVAIVQHMPGPFLSSFAHMLNRNLPQMVGLMRDDAPMEAGQILLAPELGRDATVSRLSGRWVGHLTTSAQTAAHCPSIDALFTSAMPYAADVIGVILTGLGRDGARALQHLRAGGAHTIGQDAGTSVVYGMPRAAFELDAVTEQLPLDRIGPAINAAVADYLGGRGKMRG
ncbi:chemotaxis-specific protein-glutamate methyltransferase CheB [Sulfitobacter sp. TSTF-M16]|uniref:Protein-glutamate methylesterase/protein-glutamine glutaminase n=1 Tax=Sulfitobacter aestuariivivens TaxID=2766981 RepID=A0A927D188_9RHOB|nr:chemotaxis-specific protein-glutamate methyltransferase CheB [Sulfitobacter aestuariivivens]MBD3663213.1 chemotaxis-specific protein-glutamate methyltransferase CheB [Sulfitobacter aestuariivivens]